jgi:PAS domain S-box-containing protein
MRDLTSISSGQYVSPQGQGCSELSYRALVELAVDGILVGNASGVVVDANEASCNIFGLTRHQIIGRHIAKLPFQPESLKKNPFRFDLVKRGNIVVTERVVLRPDGTRVNIEMRSRMIPDGTMHCFMRDVTERKREEKTLRDNEERYRQLFELESDALFLIDDEVGQIIEANASAMTLYGYRREELLAMRDIDLSPEPESRQLALYGPPQQNGNIVAIPLRFHRKADGVVFPVEITARYFEQGGRAVHVVAVRDITERKRAEDVLRESESLLWRLTETLELRVVERTRELEAVNLSLAQSLGKLRKLTAELMQAEERERKRLALLLHDHLQPFLVAATMRVSLLSQPVSDEERTQVVQEALGLIKSAIKASRSLTTDLYPPILLDAGLMPGLHWLGEWVKETYGLTVELSGDESLEVSETLGILLFQMIRELLFNVAKHAKVDHATVNLVKTKDNVIQVEVADQGVGFSESITDGKGPSSGIGLFHLRERLLAIGGLFETCSCAGQGSKVLVSVPLDVELSSENPGKGKGTRDEQ